MLPLVMYATSDLVLVLDELAEDAAHRDDVVVRMRREADRCVCPVGSLLLPRIFAPSALNTSPFTAPGDPNCATSDDMPCSA